MALEEKSGSDTIHHLGKLDVCVKKCNLGKLVRVHSTHILSRESFAAGGFVYSKTNNTFHKVVQGHMYQCLC